MNKMTEEEILEVFCIDIEDLIFNKDDLNFNNVKYRKLNRVECALLVYMYKIYDSDVCYQILFEEIVVIFKRHLRNKYFKTLNGGTLSDNDLFHDFIIIFDRIISSFRITETHSFKKYADRTIRGEIQKLMSEKYFYIYKAPVGKNIHLLEKMSETDDGDIYSKLPDSFDLESSILSKISKIRINEFLLSTVRDNKIPLDDLNMFIEFHGVYDEPIKQKELALKYRCSISYISKRIKRTGIKLKELDILNIIV